MERVGQPVLAGVVPRRRRGRRPLRPLGEGDYAETEQAIRSLLTEAGQSGLARGQADPEGVVVPSAVATPETYLGSERSMGFARPLTPGTRRYAAPRELAPNGFALGGRWRVGEQSSTAAGTTATISARVSAKVVYLVLAPPVAGREGTARVRVDGRATRTVRVGSQRLYTLAELPEAGEHDLEVTLSKGTSAYAFTFG